MALKGRNASGNPNEKLFWMIGFSLIIFLVLVLISVVALKNVRNRIDSLGELSVEQNLNYEVLDNGLKKNNNVNLAETEITIEQIVFSHFSITEGDSMMDEVDRVDSNILFEVENKAEEGNGEGSYIIKLFDSEENELTRFSLRLGKLPSNKKIPFRQNLGTSCVNAARVEIEKIHS